MLNIHGYLYGVLARAAQAAGGLLCASFLCLSIVAAPALAHVEQGPAATQQQIKAAMLYKFLGYVEWSEQAVSPDTSAFRIWVLGAEDIYQELQSITAGRNINQRTIDVFTTKTTRAIKDPHLVFVGQGAERLLPALQRLARERSFLIVTENQQGLPAHSIINFRVIEGRIGFDVSLINAHQQQLKLSARLLSVASTVERDTP
jgi:hypothetical protein